MVGVLSHGCGVMAEMTAETTATKSTAVRRLSITLFLSLSLFLHVIVNLNIDNAHSTAGTMHQARAI